MNQNEKPQNRFSKAKTDLKSGEFDEIVDHARIKDIVLANRELVMNSEIAKRGLGIFRFPNFEKFFSLDGSIISKDKPEELFYLDFFRKSGRIATKEIKEIKEKSGKKEIENK